MTTQPDPTIRERLRELAAKAWFDRFTFDGDRLRGWLGEGQRPIADMRYVKNGNIGDFIAACDPTTIKALLDELDTLERRVRAAEGALTAIAHHGERSGVIACPKDYGYYVEPMQTIARAVLEARSLISGTEEPTDG